MLNHIQYFVFRKEQSTQLAKPFLGIKALKIFCTIAQKWFINIESEIERQT